MFTCTGSEANDLALRIAKYRTGRDGVIVTSEAYHGNSAQTAEISPSLGENAPLGEWVRQVRPQQHLAGDVHAAIADLERQGERRRRADRRLRVQLGRHLHAPDRRARPGRRSRETRPAACSSPTRSSAASVASATSLWGYQRHGVDPDIVTLGKPMGNGFPVAGLAVRRGGRRRLRRTTSATSTPSAATRSRSPRPRRRSTSSATSNWSRTRAWSAPRCAPA